MVVLGFSLLPVGKPSRDEIENTTPTTTIIPIITDIVATSITEGISSLHSSFYLPATTLFCEKVQHAVPIMPDILTR